MNPLFGCQDRVSSYVAFSTTFAWGVVRTSQIRDAEINRSVVNYLQMQAVPLDGMTFGALVSRTRSIRYGAARCASTTA